jgi:hypothetical protein
MGILEDMLKALDRIPGWKRLQTVPDEVDELKKKVAALEEKLGGNYPPDVCRSCGERQARLIYTYAADAVVYETWRCRACGADDQRVSKAAVRS